MSPLRAIVFDLDDTLYPLRRYRLSGFRAVARDVARRGGDGAAACAAMVGALRRGEGDRAFQLAGLDVTSGGTHDALKVFREHQPSLRLPRASADVLRVLRPTWLIGLLTNGLPDIQKRKVKALGLEALVDGIVYAHEVSDTGKPDTAVFTHIAARLGVRAADLVMVGDDPRTDIEGGHRFGCSTILLRRDGAAPLRGVEQADVVIADISAVPDAAERAWKERACRGR